MTPAGWPLSVAAGWGEECVRGRPGMRACEGATVRGVRGQETEAECVCVILVAHVGMCHSVTMRTCEHVSA